MKQPDPFDLIARRTLASLWYEAEMIVHGDTFCGHSICPHRIDMADLLEAISRVHPPLYEDDPSPPLLAN